MSGETELTVPTSILRAEMSGRYFVPHGMLNYWNSLPSNTMKTQSLNTVMIENIHDGKQLLFRY